MDSDIGIRIDAIAPDFVLTDHYHSFLAMHDNDTIGRDAFAKRHPYVRDDNTISSALLLTYGEFRAVLGGDVTNTTWERAVPDPIRGGCQVVKLSHHGSEKGNFPADRLLCEHVGLVAGGTALISGGYREKLPAEVTLKALRKRKDKVYRTGAIGESLPYNPHATIADPLARQHVSTACRIVVAKSFHGNITIRGFPNGEYEVAPEIRRPRLPKRTPVK